MRNGGRFFWAYSIKGWGTGICVAEMGLPFFDGPEYRGRNTSKAVFVKGLYRAFFDRTPDSGGFNHWAANQLSTGRTSRRDVVRFFANSNEFASRCSRCYISLAINYSST